DCSSQECVVSQYDQWGDYESLRIGGLVFAVVLFVLGIALILFCWQLTKP
uniref:FXYD domain-containing ion transport regulator n=1 Tax=Anabas testudineus TaxID=64144 RepID=A0A3Q1JAV9_ANATE